MKIRCVDTVKGMQSLKPESVDLTVTSPPYGNIRKYNGFEWDFEETARQLYRVTKTGGIVVWVVGDETVDGSESGESFRQALFFKECGFRLHDTMIYRKFSSHPETNRYYQVFEYMFIFSKGKPKTVNLLKDRPNKWHSTEMKFSTRESDGSIKRKKKKQKIEAYGVRNNIWEYNVGFKHTTGDEIAKKHPALMPEKLVEDHIQSWSNPGDLVLDPFCGAGTTCKMAKILGRDYVGFDISKEYVEIARQRVEKTSYIDTEGKKLLVDDVKNSNESNSFQMQSKLSKLQKQILTLMYDGGFDTIKQLIRELDGSGHSFQNTVYNSVASLDKRGLVTRDDGGIFLTDEGLNESRNILIEEGEMVKFKLRKKELNAILKKCSMNKKYPDTVVMVRDGKFTSVLRTNVGNNIVVFEGNSNLFDSISGTDMFVFPVKEIGFVLKNLNKELVEFEVRGNVIKITTNKLTRKIACKSVDDYFVSLPFNWESDLAAYKELSSLPYRTELDSSLLKEFYSDNVTFSDGVIIVNNVQIEHEWKGPEITVENENFKNFKRVFDGTLLVRMDEKHAVFSESTVTYHVGILVPI